MACKRITISLTEEKYEAFREALPAKANISEVCCDLVQMFINAVEEYGDDFILDVMRGGNSYGIHRIMKK
jgi:hypothetical protein